MKFVAATALTALFAFIIVSGPVRRYRANLERRNIELLVLRAEREGTEYGRQQLAHDAIDRANRWLEHDPADYKLLILRGSAEAAAQQRERALATYRHALTVNERPEIYAYIGVLEIERGEIEKAIEDLTKAAMFNVATKRLVAAPTHERIDRALDQRRRRLMKKAKE